MISRYINKVLCSTLHRKIDVIIILRILISFTLLWISIGYFPLLNLEGDGALFSAGCERLVANGFSLPPDYFYEWNMQPLVGIIVAGSHYLLPLLSCELIYNLFTIICSVSYLFVASAFISKLTKLRWEYCFFVLVLFPESYSIGYYSNTTIFASLAFIIALLHITKNPLNIISILFLGIAPLLRVDVLVIYPVVLLVCWLQVGPKKAIIYSSIYALCTFIISFIGFYLLKANPILMLNAYSSIVGGEQSFDYQRFIGTSITYYPVAIVVMIIYGIRQHILAKQYILLTLSLLPVAVLYYLYVFSGTGVAAPKHFQYLLPFWGTLVAMAIVELKNHIIVKKYLLTYLISSLIVVQAIIGVRYYPVSKPWVAKDYTVMYSRPTIATLFTMDLKQRGIVQCVVGAGLIIPTVDELMLVSGTVFAPLYWHSVKIAESEERKAIERILHESSDTTYIMTTTASDWRLSQQLHSIGYSIQNPIVSNFCYNTWFTKDMKRICVTRVEAERTSESFNSAFQEVLHRPLYFLVSWDWELYFINEGLTNAMPITNRMSIIN